MNIIFYFILLCMIFFVLSIFGLILLYLLYKIFLHKKNNTIFTNMKSLLANNSKIIIITNIDGNEEIFKEVLDKLTDVSNNIINNNEIIYENRENENNENNENKIKLKQV